MKKSQTHLKPTEAKGLCKFWQEVLRLQDWDVTVKIVRGNGLDLPVEVQGRCIMTPSRKEAVIKMLDPVDYDPDFQFPQDMEVTLVHELLHLHFVSFQRDPNAPESREQEQVIHALSEALVELSR